MPSKNREHILRTKISWLSNTKITNGATRNLNIIRFFASFQRKMICIYGLCLPYCKSILYPIRIRVEMLLHRLVFGFWLCPLYQYLQCKVVFSFLLASCSNLHLSLHLDRLWICIHLNITILQRCCSNNASCMKRELA